MGLGRCLLVFLLLQSGWKTIIFRLPGFYCSKWLVLSLNILRGAGELVSHSSPKRYVLEAGSELVFNLLRLTNYLAPLSRVQWVTLNVG